MAHKDKPSWQQRLIFWLALNLLGRILRLMFRTCRVELLTPALEEDFFKPGRQAVGVTWHRSAIFSLYFFGKQHAAIMVSRSRDGEYLARYLELMGGVPVRGSSKHGGVSALINMERMLKEGQVTYAATVADGPRGPRYVAKKGMILLAMRTGLPILPVMWSADRAWIFKKAWDRTVIPKPFARIKLAMGEPITYPPKMDNDQLEAARKTLEDELNRLRDELDALTGYQDPI